MEEELYVKERRQTISDIIIPEKGQVTFTNQLAINYLSDEICTNESMINYLVGSRSKMEQQDSEFKIVMPMEDGGKSVHMYYDIARDIAGNKIFNLELEFHFKNVGYNQVISIIHLTLNFYLYELI